MNPSRLFKKEYAKELLKVAADDLESAIVLKNGNVSRKEIDAAKAILLWSQKFIR